MALVSEPKFTTVWMKQLWLQTHYLGAIFTLGAICKNSTHVQNNGSSLILCVQIYKIGITDMVSHLPFLKSSYRVYIPLRVNRKTPVDLKYEVITA